MSEIVIKLPHIITDGKNVSHKRWELNLACSLGRLRGWPQASSESLKCVQNSARDSSPASLSLLGQREVMDDFSRTEPGQGRVNFTSQQVRDAFS